MCKGNIRLITAQKEQWKPKEDINNVNMCATNKMDQKFLK